jgi:hypothetical protein
MLKRKEREGSTSLTVPQRPQSSEVRFQALLPAAEAFDAAADGAHAALTPGGRGLLADGLTATEALTT